MGDDPAFAAELRRRSYAFITIHHHSSSFIIVHHHSSWRGDEAEVIHRAHHHMEMMLR